MTHPDDVLPGCLYSEVSDDNPRGRRERVNCYGSVGLDRDGQPHTKEDE